MKNIELVASIVNNTNKVISTTESDWSMIREGSFFKFKDDHVFYPIAKSSSFLSVKDFEVIDPFTIKLKENVGVNICPRDFLKISYKEYELFTVISITSKGKGYKAGEVLNLEGGTPSIQTEDGSKKIASISIVEADGSGSLSRIKIENRGKYLNAPSGKIKLAGGSGTDAEIEIEFRLLDVRGSLEREVSEILMNNSSSQLKLNYPLPDGLKNGKFSIEKWELTLAANYINGDKFNKEFDVIRDFTESSRLPLISKNSFNVNTVYNEAMMRIDAEIKSLKKENQILKKEIEKLKSGEN